LILIHKIKEQHWFGILDILGALDSGLVFMVIGFGFIWITSTRIHYFFPCILVRLGQYIWISISIGIFWGKKGWIGGNGLGLK